jgi:hypothetical protein
VDTEIVKGERSDDLRLIDEIHTLRNRCFGLEAAIKGMGASYNEIKGVRQLASDLANGMAALTDAFEAEQQLRIAEKQQ